MKNALWMLLLYVGSLHAGMEAILLLPRDGRPVMGVYAGMLSYAADVRIGSSDADVDGRVLNKNAQAPLAGIYLGVSNKSYRLGLSYDIAPATDIRIERFMMTFDFSADARDGIRPTVGLSIGAVENTYDTDAKTLRQSNGMIEFRAGALFRTEEKTSPELTLAYGIQTGTPSSSAFEGDTFNTYRLEYNRMIMLRFGYRFFF